MSNISKREARDRLHEIIREDIPFDEKVHDALELGSEYLETDNGYLTQIDQKTDHWEAVVSVDSEQKPSNTDLGETYCRETISDDFQLSLHDAPNQGWGDDPAFENTGIHTYLGTPLVLADDVYGTVCFVSENPRPESFSKDEAMFAEYIARLLERELGKKEVETELTIQTNLATVLNRVLRHNLRNDISVIRGYTEMVSEQIEDDSNIQTALSHIDSLIELSRKARDLEEIISESSERQQTEVTDLVDRTVERVAQEYPSASVSVNYEEEIHAAVLANFNRAIEELVENAAKHSGESPKVEVAVETVPNAVEISVEDNGSGLSDQEIKVLQEGTETPLAHSSGLGLWLAHWIVTSHDGSLDANVTQNGTTMTVSVPRKPAISVQKHLTEVTQSRDKYKSSFEEAYDSMVIVNDEGRIIEANPAAGRTFGLDTQKLLGRSLTEFLPDDFEFETEWQEFKESGVERDTATVACFDGDERVLEYSATADIIPGHHLFISRDVTERRERERDLSEMKERYQTLIEAAPDPIFVADAEAGEITETNEAAERLIGEPRSEIIGKHQRKLHPPDDAEMYREAFEKSRGRQTTIERLPDGSRPKLQTARGETVPIELSAATVSLSDGSVIFGIFRDISERVEREREVTMRTRAMDKAPVPISITDPEREDNPMIYVNEAFCELTGYDEDEVVGENCRLLQGTNTDPESASEIRNAIDDTEPVTVRLRNYTKDGTEFWNEVYISPIKDDEGNIVNWIGFQEDVTDRVENG